MTEKKAYEAPRIELFDAVSTRSVMEDVVGDKSGGATLPGGSTGHDFVDDELPYPSSGATRKKHPIWDRAL